jgi:hypothetical protein
MSWLQAILTPKVFSCGISRENYDKAQKLWVVSPTNYGIPSLLPRTQFLFSRKSGVFEWY